MPYIHHSLVRRRLLQATGATLATLASPALLRAQSAPIVLGRTAGMSAAMPFAEMGKGIQAALDEINEAGGIDGRKLAVTTLDDEGSPQKAAENAKALLGRGATALFCTGPTPSVMGVMQVVNQAKVPFLAPATGLDQLRNVSPFLAYMRASYGREMFKIVQQAHTMNLNRFAVIYQDNAFGKAMLSAVDAAAKAHPGFAWKPFLLEDKKESIPKVAQEVTAWQPNGLTTVVSGSIGIPFFQVLRTQLKAQAFAMSILSSKAILDALGDAGKGLAITQVMPNPDNVALKIVRSYRAAIQKAGSSDFNYNTLEGYVYTRIAAEALRRAGPNLGTERIMRALYSMQPYDAGGFEVSYSPEDLNGSRFVELTYFNGERFRR